MAVAKTACPLDWPADLPWGAYLDVLVSPDTPLVCLIHPDLYSSQRNEAEADLVAGLVLTLHRRRLLHLEQDNARAYDTIHFFGAGVGGGTPQRAHRGAARDPPDASLPPNCDTASLHAG